MAEQYAVPTPAQETPSRPLSLSENTEAPKGENLNKHSVKINNNEIKSEDFNLDHFYKQTKELDRNHLSKSGRSLQKHNASYAHRDNSFPNVKPNWRLLNTKGEEISKKILEDPTKKIYRKWIKGIGNVIDIHEKHGNGKGIRFTKDGRMIGFLEPKNKTRKK